MMRMSRRDVRSNSLLYTVFRQISISFFFQAEDGILDFHVTGVQTCALPIYLGAQRGLGDVEALRRAGEAQVVRDRQEVPQALQCHTHRATLSILWPFGLGPRRGGGTTLDGRPTSRRSPDGHRGETPSASFVPHVSFCVAEAVGLDA